MKIIFNIIKTLIFLVLLFFALFTVFSALIPLIQSGLSFWEAIKSIAVMLVESVKALFGI